VFVRNQRGGNSPYEYLMIVENRRVRGRRVQRVIGTIGRRDRLALADGRTLDQLLRSLIRWRAILRGPQPVGRRDLEEEARVTGGRVVDGGISYPPGWVGGRVGGARRGPQVVEPSPRDAVGAAGGGVTADARATGDGGSPDLVSVDLTMWHSINGIDYWPGRVWVSRGVADTLLHQEDRARRSGVL
jgi:hypothetical protein